MYNLDSDSSEQLLNMSFTKTQEINQEEQYTKLKCEDKSIKKIVDSLLLNIDTKPSSKIQQNKNKSCQKWSKKNAKIFEKLLHIFGTDFALIEEYFRLHTNQHFNEKILRNKYKREYQLKKIKQSNQFSDADSLDRQIQQNLTNSQ